MHFKKTRTPENNCKEIWPQKHEEGMVGLGCPKKGGPEQGSTGDGGRN
jgi:hypothetical protein